MDRMLALLGDQEPCLLFRHLFLQRLPAQVRALLLQRSEGNMRKLAEQADLTWQGLKSSFSLLTNAVSEPGQQGGQGQEQPQGEGQLFRSMEEGVAPGPRRPMHLPLLLQD